MRLFAITVGASLAFWLAVFVLAVAASQFRSCWDFIPG